MMKKLTNLDPTWSGWYNMCVASSGSGSSETGGNWTCSKYTKNYYTDWKVMPCVTDRFYDASWNFGLTDAAPGPGNWLNAHDGSRMTLGPDSSTTVATSKTGESKALAAEHWNFSGAGDCADVAESNEILPLTNNVAALKDRIDGLSAYGATSGVLGTAWSWYMLSPKWSSVFPSASEPKDYSLLSQVNSSGAPKLRKIAILMTDGVYNTFRGWKDQDTTFVSNNAVSMCTQMKNAGIEIYTIGFALNGLTAAEKNLAINTLQSCGSDVEHFYQSINAQQLRQAFESIGNKVSSTAIRLTN
jgi:hypothetical protein